MGDAKMKNKLIRRLVTCEIKQRCAYKRKGKRWLVGAIRSRKLELGEMFGV